MIEFEITRMELSAPDDYGKHTIEIKQVKVLKNGKYVKFAKLNNELIKAIKENPTIKIKQ